MMTKKIKNFEESLKRLQEISDLLESDNTGLDDSIKLYEEGIELSKELYEKLNKAELKITELKKGMENQLSDTGD